MKPDSMHVETLVGDAPSVLNELATELVRVGGQSMDEDPNSQRSACFLVAIRCCSLLVGMGHLLDPSTCDSWDVVARSFMESRDLLLTFRFNEKGTRDDVKIWFQGKNDSSWRPRHKKAEAFVKRLGAGDTELGKRWSAFSALSHPTIHAAKNSTNFVVTWVTRRHDPNADEVMRQKRADYLVSISTLIVAATFEVPEWIELGCDLTRIPHVESFRLAVWGATSGITEEERRIPLPPESYRST